MILICSMLLLPLLFYTFQNKQSTLSVFSLWHMTIALLGCNWLTFSTMVTESNTVGRGPPTLTSLGRGRGNKMAPGDSDSAAEDCIQQTEWRRQWEDSKNETGRKGKETGGKTASRCFSLIITTFIKRVLKIKTKQSITNKSWEFDSSADVEQMHQLHYTTLCGSSQPMFEAKDCGEI